MQVAQVDDTARAVGQREYPTTSEPPANPAPANAAASLHLDPLTGLRGIAAYCVLVGHSLATAFVYGSVSTFIGEGSTFNDLASRLAWFGMSLFFVLSGFVICYNYADAFQKKPILSAGYDFLVARFARLYPLYAVSILTSLVYIPSPLFANDMMSALAYLTLTQSWFNREMVVFSPAWSVSTEWFFYFAFVPFTFVLARIRHPVRTLVIFLVAVPVPLIILFRYQTVLVAAFTPLAWHGDKISAPVWGWIIYFCPLTRMLEFIAGTLAAKAYLSRRDVPISPRMGQTVIGLCLAWCAAVLFVPSISQSPLLNDLRCNFIFTPALAPLLYCCVRYKNWLSKALASPPLLFMGDISYSVYIWSFSVIVIMGSQFVSSTPSPLAYFNSTVKFACDVAITTIFAAGSYRLVEVPSRRWLRSVLHASRGQEPGKTMPGVAVADSLISR